MFLAGIGLLCAGIVATSDGFWGRPRTEISMPVDVGGVDTADLRGARIEKVVFSDAEAPGLRYSVLPYMADESGKGKQPVVATAGSTLRITVPEGFFVYQSTLVLPTRIGKVMVRDMRFAGKARVPAIVVEATGDVSWNVDADSASFVDVSSDEPKRKDDCECRKPSFSIKGGSIGSLSITSAKGSIELGDMAGVGTIDLKTGPEASLKLEHVADLPRVRIEGIGGEPEAPPVH
ncbi:MAG: hypothetical protein QM719_08055 [Thermomonas sp.]